MDDRLKFTGSIRYDKAKIMMEMYRQGVSLCILVVKVGDITLEDHFKPVLEILPQDQYIGFNVGSAILLGSNQIT
jgi:hypothetical protein